MSDDKRPRDESAPKTKTRIKIALKRAEEVTGGIALALVALGEPTAGIFGATAFACKVIAARIKD
jgi:hypothetical protein